MIVAVVATILQSGAEAETVAEGSIEEEVLAAGEPVELPLVPGREVHHEAELAILIGKQCRGIRREDWQDYVFGYACLLDMVVRGREFDDPADWQWALDTWRSLTPSPSASTMPAPSSPRRTGSSVG